MKKAAQVAAAQRAKAAMVQQMQRGITGASSSAANSSGGAAQDDVPPAGSDGSMRDGGSEVSDDASEVAQNVSHDESVRSEANDGSEVGEERRRCIARAVQGARRLSRALSYRTPQVTRDGVRLTRRRCRRA